MLRQLGPRVAVAEDESRQVGEREDPSDANQHHRRRDQGAVTDQLPGAERVDPLDHRRQLEPDEDEQRRVQQEGDDLPDGEVLDARRRRGQPRGQASHVDADGDRSQHAGYPDRLRREVGEVGGEERDRDLDRRVVQTRANPGDDGADRDADGDPAGDRHDELAARLERAEAARDHRGDRELVGHERGAVVDQALALDDRHRPSGHTEAASDRRGGDRVRGGDDRAEHEGFRPAKVERLVSDHRDDDHRREHEADRQERDRADGALQLAQRREEGGRVEQRGEQDEQDELRLELDVRHLRDERQTQPPDHHQDRIRHPDPAGDDEQRDDGGENSQQRDIRVHEADSCSWLGSVLDGDRGRRQPRRAAL